MDYLTKKRILVCSHTGSFYGGAERCLVDFLTRTTIPKKDFLVVIPYYERNGLQDQLNKIGIENKVIHKFNKFIPLKNLIKNPFLLFITIIKNLIFAIRFSFLVLRYNPDVVYVNTILCEIETIISKIFRKKVILHTHGLTNRWKLRLHLIGSSIDKFITVSEFEKDLLLEYGIKKPIVIIHNGIDEGDVVLKDKIRKNPKKIVVLYIANIYYLKGQDIYFRIADKILARNKNVEFWQVGEKINESDDFYSKLMRKYDKHIKNGNIVLWGYRKNVYDFLDACDVFLFPSRQEGFPLSILESMMMKKPTITFNRDGRKEQIENNKSGFLVNSEKEMIEMLEKLIRSKRLRDKIGGGAYVRVKNNFSKLNFVSKLTDAIIPELK